MISNLIKIYVVFAVLDGIITFYALLAYPTIIVELNSIAAAMFAFEPMVASMLRLGVVAVALLFLWELSQRNGGELRMWIIGCLCLLIDVEVFAVIANVLQLGLIQLV